METVSLGKWDIQILTVFAEQLAFRGLVPEESTSGLAAVKEEEEDSGIDVVARGTATGSSTNKTLSFRIKSVDLERMCGYTQKTPFKDRIRSAVKANLILVGGRGMKSFVSLTHKGLATVCVSTIRIPKFRSNKEIHRYLTTNYSNRICAGNQNILFDYLWDDGQYKTYRQLADHLCEATGRCYDPTATNFKAIIRGLRRADVVEHKLVGQRGTDIVRIQQHFYHIDGPPSPTPTGVGAVSAVKQEDFAVKLEATQAQQGPSINAGVNKTTTRQISSSSVSSSCNAVKQESESRTGSKKLTLTAREEQDEFRRKQQQLPDQQQQQQERKKPRTELNLQSCRPVDSELKLIRRSSSPKDSTSAGSLNGHTYYIKPGIPMCLLDDDERTMIDKFEQYLYEVEAISRENRASVMTQATKMLAGVGVKWKVGKKNYGWFLKGQKINFLQSDFLALLNQAKECEEKWGKDKGNGWAMRHPLKKLHNFQRYFEAHPDFLNKSPAPSSDSDNRPSKALLVEKEKGETFLPIASRGGGGGGGQFAQFLSLYQSGSNNDVSGAAATAAVVHNNDGCFRGEVKKCSDHTVAEDQLSRLEQFPAPQKIKAEPNNTNFVPQMEKPGDLFRSASTVTASTTTSITTVSARDGENDDDNEDGDDDDDRHDSTTTTTTKPKDKKDDDTNTRGVSFYHSSPLIPSSSSPSSATKAFEL